MDEQQIEKMRDSIVESEIALAKHFFSQAGTLCKYREGHDHDCHHPDLDFYCMCCRIQNCPLLEED